MQTIVGTEWTLDYIIQNGKLIGMKYNGKAKNMKEAIDRLGEIVALEAAKFNKAA